MSPRHRARTRLGRAVAILLAIVAVGSCTSSAPSAVLERAPVGQQSIPLPPPTTAGTMPVEQALAERRSQREYADEPLEAETIGQLLWAGQGITDSEGRRTTPSAGARYPLELYVIDDDGVDHYLPDGHRLEPHVARRVKDQLGRVAFGQDFVADASHVVVIAAVFERSEVEYGAVAHDLVNREAGHAAENILLQATALELAAVPVGGFDPAEVAELLALPPGHEVLYLIPVGRPADGS